MSTDTPSHQMAETSNNVVPLAARTGRLADAMQRAREAAGVDTDQDVNRERLLALAADLKAIGDELPLSDTDRFALIPSNHGERLVIDDLAYVDLDPNSDAFRLMRRYRNGLESVAQSSQRNEMADAVADYIVTRMSEQAREGEDQSAEPADPVTVVKTEYLDRPLMSVALGLFLFVLGGILAVTAFFTYAWLLAGPQV